MDEGGHLLVVDNDQEICDMLRICFEDEGYRVSTASTRAAAARLLSDGAVDFALIDIMLPDAPGGHSLAELARDQSIPCLLMTGHPAHMSSKTRDNILRKPFRLAELMQRVMVGIQTRRYSTESIDCVGDRAD